MGELIFRSDKWDEHYKRWEPYRVYDLLNHKWALEKADVAHLTPDMADISRLPEGLPDQVVRTVEGFVNDAKIHGRWFCIRKGDLDDEQDEDVLTAAAYLTENEDEDKRKPLIDDYHLHLSPGYHGPTPTLLRLLCT